MQCEQRVWERQGTNSKWAPSGPVELGSAALVLVFGDRFAFDDSEAVKAVERAYPMAVVTGCTTAGEICGSAVSAGGLTTTAILFNSGYISADIAPINEENSRQAGARLGAAILADDLVHVFVISEGLSVNGSELVKGLESALPTGVTVTGGLSGDAERFEQTGVLWRGTLSESVVVAIGLCGRDLEVGFGTYGGWDSFGPERTITRSKGSVLYELDGRSALSLYREYLGDFAPGLPATGLLFPLSLRESPDESGRVRTILGIDEEEGALIFAGDVPERAFARLMTANIDRLVEGAAEAARIAQPDGAPEPGLAILVSCFGRKMVLRQRIEEELEAVADVLRSALLTGFYSYGEIAPRRAARCDLHNQTMTITTMRERS